MKQEPLGAGPRARARARARGRHLHSVSLILPRALRARSCSSESRSARRSNTRRGRWSKRGSCCARPATNRRAAPTPGPDEAVADHPLVDVADQVAHAERARAMPAALRRGHAEVAQLAAARKVFAVVVAALGVAHETVRDTARARRPRRQIPTRCRSTDACRGSCRSPARRSMIAGRAEGLRSEACIRRGRCRSDDAGVARGKAACARTPRSGEPAVPVRVRRGNADTCAGRRGNTRPRRAPFPRGMVGPRQRDRRRQHPHRAGASARAVTGIAFGSAALGRSGAQGRYRFRTGQSACSRARTRYAAAHQAGSPGRTNTRGHSSPSLPEAVGRGSAEARGAAAVHCTRASRQRQIETLIADRSARQAVASAFGQDGGKRLSEAAA